ncbi:MAG: glycoside hydrolase [Nitrososphaeraceae archaeon]|nr:glycoside hydrolase [Nitrososphaeraceae archaeon]
MSSNINTFSNLSKIILLSFLILVLIFITISSPSNSTNNAYSQNDKILDLSNGIINSTNPIIQLIDNNTIYVVWTGITNHGFNEEVQSDIFLARSENNGDSFEKINVSNDPGSSFNPKFIASSNKIFVVWEDDTFSNKVSQNINTSIFFKQSDDKKGLSFSSPISLSSSNKDSSNPDISVNNDKNLFVVWEDTYDGISEISLQSQDIVTIDNTTFSEVKIISGDNKEGEYETSPHVVTTNNTINIIWIDTNFNKEISKILKRTSIDNGINFQNTNQLNNDSKMSGKIVTNSNNEEIYVLWQEDINGHYDVYLSKSSDGGTTFKESVNVSNDLGDSINPNFIISSNNDVHVVWNDNSTDKGNNIFIKSSSDGGTTFKESVNVSNSTNSNSINPQIVSNGNEIFVVWQEDINGHYDVYLSKSSDGGTTFKEPINVSNSTNSNSINPQIVSNGNEIFVVWQEDKSGNNHIYFTKFIDSIS